MNRREFIKVSAVTGVVLSTGMLSMFSNRVRHKTTGCKGTIRFSLGNGNYCVLWDRHSYIGKMLVEEYGGDNYGYPPKTFAGVERLHGMKWIERI
jgi:hypothetical protein